MVGIMRKLIVAVIVAGSLLFHSYTAEATGTGCIADPASCGYPEATNTGVPAGTNLTTYSGTLKALQAGATYSGLDIRGCVDIRAANVTIQNSRITCSRVSATVKVYSGNVTIQDTEINGGGGAGNCVGSNDFTLIRVNIHNCLDGVRANGRVVIRDSFIHSLKRVAGGHHDTIQTTQGANITIEHNTLFPFTNGDPMNAAYIAGEDQGPISNVTLRDNLMNGGNYTLYFAAGIDGATVTGNVFGRNFRYGPVSGNRQAVGPTNVYFDTGEPVVP